MHVTRRVKLSGIQLVLAPVQLLLFHTPLLFVQQSCWLSPLSSSHHPSFKKSSPTLNHPFSLVKADSSVLFGFLIQAQERLGATSTIVSYTIDGFRN